MQDLQSPKTSVDSWNPAQYERFQKERDQPFFDLLTMIEGAGFSRALDLGCGTGALTSVMHQRFQIQDTLGLDSSQAMIAKAPADPGLHFKVQTIEAWQPEGSYDLVVSNAALHWCDRHGELFKKIYNALRPGGQIAIQMPANYDYPTHRVADVLQKEEPFRSGMKGAMRLQPMLLPEDYASLLHRLGFREQAVEMRVYGHVLDSREDVIEWVKGSLLTFYKAQMPNDIYERFLQRYRERLFEVLPDQRPFFYPFKRIFLWACR